MNAVLHNKATIKIMAGNTFSDPQFIKADDPSELERFDYIVANEAVICGLTPEKARNIKEFAA